MKNSLRVARAERRMTQQQLADAVGVSRQTINAVEAGKFVPYTLQATEKGVCRNESLGTRPAAAPPTA